MNNQNQNQQSLPALAKQHIATVENRVMEMEKSGQIHLPPHYSASNALRAAFLQLQEVVDKSDNPALQTCTQSSITNALLRMVVQGLSPDKSQCYFMVYGKKLACHRSYHGTMAVTQMVRSDIPLEGFAYAVVYEGDELEYEIRRGKTVVTCHKQKLENIKKDKIIAAYCEIYNSDDRLVNSELMTLDQIKQAWKQSPTKPVNDDGSLKTNSTHAKFTEDMALKTVISKTCRPIINSSSDKTLLNAATKDEQVQAEQEAEQIAEENANQEVIDVEPAEAEQVNENTGEVIEEPQGQGQGQEENQGNEQATETDGPEF